MPNLFPAFTVAEFSRTQCKYTCSRQTEKRQKALVCSVSPNHYRTLHSWHGQQPWTPLASRWELSSSSKGLTVQLTLKWSFSYQRSWLDTATVVDLAMYREGCLKCILQCPGGLLKGCPLVTGWRLNGPARVKEGMGGGWHKYQVTLQFSNFS